MSNENLVLVNSVVTTPVVTNDGSQLKEMFMNFIPFILLLVVFYFFILRPQINKHKQQEALIKSVKKGDKVIVAGGIIGKIIKEQDGVLTLEISKNSTMEVLKSSVVSVFNDSSTVAQTK